MKQLVFDNLKNILGWKTNRKIVVFSVDDYGNVRLHSKQARKNLDKNGLKVKSRFDAYDALETREDLEALYEVLSCVKDKEGKPAVFTPYALPCNLDFESIVASKRDYYVSEALPDTYNKLSAIDSDAYEGAWDLWKEGISKGLMRPQFHGREHLNMRVFEEKLRKKDKEVLVNLQNRSYTSISSTGYPTIGYTAAFAFKDQNEFLHLKEILEDGVKQFENVFGYRSKTFTPPAQQFPSKMMPLLKSYGIKAIDRPFIHHLHIGNSKFRREINVMGKDSKFDVIKLVRNVVFEPTQNSSNHVGKALQQVQAAFRWNKPAIISSHRVNFCGHIDENNRKMGLENLRMLLYEITKRWPDVEFMAADELSEVMVSDNKE